VFKSGDPVNSPWAPARCVWNQYAYNTLNVNKDLTIPKVPMSTSTRFAGNDGILGNGDDVRPFNNFLQQQTLLNKDGEPLWLAPEAQIIGIPIFKYDESSDNMQITLTVKNTGDADFRNPFFVTAYKDNVGMTPKLTHIYPHPIIVGESVTISFTIPNFYRDWCPYHFILLKINDNGNGLSEQEVCRDSKSQYRYYGIIPTEQDLCRGKPTTISCNFVLPASTNTYQWQSSPNGITWSDIAGATSASYTAINNKRGIVYYRVIVKDDIETVESVIASIRVRSCQIPVNHNMSAMDYE